MRTTACPISLWLPWVLLMLPSLSCCDRATAMRYADGDPAGRQTITVAALKERCHGPSVRIAEELNIRGMVVANDAYGEFPKTLVLEDGTGGIEILADLPDLSHDYELGCSLTVLCNGLSLGDYGGKIQLGAPSEGSYPVARIPAERIARHLRRNSGNIGGRIPLTLGFDVLASRLISRYVRFTHVRFAIEEQGLPFCDRDPESGELLSTDRHLVDDGNDTLVLRTLPGCEYANEPLPAGRGSINGILDYFNGTYQLRIVNRELDFAP